MDLGMIIIIGIVVLALLIFINVRNKKDKKDLTDKLKNDYRKTKNEEGDAPTEETST